MLEDSQVPQDPEEQPELHGMNDDNSFHHANKDDACCLFSHDPDSIEVLIRNITLDEFIIDICKVIVFIEFICICEGIKSRIDARAKEIKVIEARLNDLNAEHFHDIILLARMGIDPFVQQQNEQGLQPNFSRYPTPSFLSTSSLLCHLKKMKSFKLIHLKLEDIVSRRTM